MPTVTINGKTVNTSREIVSGSRRLRKEEAWFAGEIVIEGSLLEFYLGVTFDPREVFGIEACVPGTDNFINVYAYYDLPGQCVDNALLITLVCADGEEKPLQYILSDEEKSFILQAMESYSKETHEMSLEDWRDAFAEQNQEWI